MFIKYGENNEMKTYSMHFFLISTPFSDDFCSNLSTGYNTQSPISKELTPMRTYWSNVYVISCSRKMQLRLDLSKQL